MRLRSPSLALLLALGALLLAYPFFEQSRGGRLALNLVGIAVIVLVTRFVAATRGDRRLAWSIATLPIAGQLAYAVHHEPWVAACVAALQALFYAFAAASFLAYMLRDEVATRDELYAAAATFVLIALMFACLYWLLDFARPGSFATALAQRADGRLTWFEFVYFSFTTLSTTGFGDIVPANSHARALVMAEQFVGVMYVALVIARLTGLLRRGA